MSQAACYAEVQFVDHQGGYRVVAIISCVEASGYL